VASTSNKSMIRRCRRTGFISDQSMLDQPGSFQLRDWYPQGCRARQRRRWVNGR
jgi:hypothetical protein